MQVADLELLLNRLRASQYHLQGSTQRGLGQTEAAPQSFNHEAALARWKFTLESSSCRHSHVLSNCEAE